VARPPPRCVHRAGHAWEQAVLPAVAARRRAPLLLSPANLAPLAFPRNVVVIHDAAALREPGWYSRLYVAWQRAVLPALAKRALHVVTVSQFSRTELIELLGLPPERITVVPGGVDERFLPGLYAGAEAFVLPSVYEGFGLTALEALACGTPTVVSDRTALPEVVGDAGILVNPDEPADIAEAVSRALGNRELGARGAARASRYSWSASASQIDALLSHLVRHSAAS
jgi:glycosyltransferase involved in cell wall biosynthesis